MIPSDLRLARRIARDQARDRVAEGRYSRHHCGATARDHACQLRLDGASVVEIAGRFGVTERTVRNWLNASGKIARLK
ncbi:helix-turn-helix domain-containing protein [Paucibacter sp. M5-1]|uniref:helix-turn-helix domain-containing protein n=1 Tax=Paucibacter sp. M5-1 TaxID=3015998 RepID=UPI003F7F848A